MLGKFKDMLNFPFGSPLSSMKSDIPHVIINGVDIERERFVCLLITFIDFPPLSFNFGVIYLTSPTHHSGTESTTDFDILRLVCACV